jgi:hypothetical protein
MISSENSQETPGMQPIALTATWSQFTVGEVLKDRKRIGIGSRHGHNISNNH